MDLLNARWAELNTSGEELNTWNHGALDKGALRHVLLALEAAENTVDKAGTGRGHREGGRASSILGLDDLITTELDAHSELLNLVLRKLACNTSGELGEEWEDSDTSVAANDVHVSLASLTASGLSNKRVGAEHIEGGDTKDLLWVIDAVTLEDLSRDGNSGVDGVGDDEERCLWAVLGACISQGGDDGGVGVEEVIAGHARLAWDTGRDDDDVGTLEGGGELVSTLVARHLQKRERERSGEDEGGRNVSGGRPKGWRVTRVKSGFKDKNLSIPLDRKVARNIIIQKWCMEACTSLGIRQASVLHLALCG